MLQDSKVIMTINGPRTYELREGVGRFGAPIYIIQSYMGNGEQDYSKGRTYHEERFTSWAEAQAWYDNCF